MHVLIVDTLQPDDSPGPSIAAFRTYELRGHAVTPVPDTTTCAWTCWSRGLFRICPPRPRGSWGLGRRVRRGDPSGARSTGGGARRATEPSVERARRPARACQCHVRTVTRVRGCAASACGPRRADEQHADVPKTTQSGEISIHHYPLPYVRLIRVSTSTEPQEAFPTEARSAARLACNRRTV